MKVLIQLTAQTVYRGKTVEALEEIEIDDKEFDLFKNIARLIGPVQESKQTTKIREDKANG